MVLELFVATSMQVTGRVAFDGEFLRLPPSGIGGYARNLIPALREVDPELDLIVLDPDWDHTVPGKRRSIRRDRRVQRAFWELVGVGKAARDAEPDLLHIPSFAAPIIGPRPLVVTIHDVIPFMLPAYRASRAMQLHLGAMRRTVSRADIVLTPSRAAADDVASELGIDPAIVRVTPEAAGPEYRPAADRERVRRELARLGITRRYIFNVGGLDVRKNVPLLLHAFAKIRSRLPEPVQLVIAGAQHSDNPSVFPPLEPVIRRLGIERDVVLTGRVSERDKVALYQAADLYVTPSFYEGFGLTALEGMACGVPTIAANRTSFPEVVGDGGLLVELDVDALASAMGLILTNDAVATDLAARGVARAAEFTWRRTAELTLDAYREAIKTYRQGQKRG
jgi:glycosyltransferase involved in cell wall biosynthesis